MSHILEAKNLSISYKDRVILEGVDLCIPEHSITVFMGHSGCGKSTLLSAFNGFLEERGGAYSGDILFRGENIRTMQMPELRRRISMLFQESEPFPLSIEKNLTYAMEFYEGRISNKTDRVEELLRRVNLYDEVKTNLSLSTEKLSGGQKQRLCIARMLTTNPDVLIFDEPCSSLDLENSLVIEALLKELSKKYTILVSTHNQDQANRIADRIVRFENGKLVSVNSLTSAWSGTERLR